MKKLSSFNPQNLKELRAAINTALGIIGEDYGIQFEDMETTRITYSATAFRFKMGATIDLGEKAEEKREPLFFAGQLGTYPPEGSRFMFKGVLFTVTEIRKRSPKFPVIARNQVTKQLHKFSLRAITPEAVKAAASLKTS